MLGSLGILLALVPFETTLGIIGGEMEITMAVTSKNKSIVEDLKNRPNARRYVQDAPLSHQQALFWLFAAIEQSRNLSRDAGVLFHRGRHATAMNLLLLAQEELSKPQIILKYMAKGINNQAEWNVTKRKLLSHDAKIEASVEYIERLVKSGEIELSFGALKKFKKMNFNLIQALKSTREASVYTFAYEGGVLVPPRIGALGVEFVPQCAEVIIELADDLIGLVEQHFPKLHRSMKKLFYAKTDEECVTHQTAYEHEIEKYLYLASFLKANFSDWQGVYRSLIAKKRLAFVVQRVCGNRSRRKYRVLFELLRKHAAMTEAQRQDLLFHKNMPKVAGKIFKKMKATGKLINP